MNADVKKKIVLTVILVAFGLTVYFQFLVGPQWGYMRERAEAAKAVRYKLAQLKGADEKEPELKRKHAELTARLAKTGGMWVQDEGLDLLRELTELAERHEVNMVSVKERKVKAKASEDAETKEAYEEKLIEFKLRCGYHALGTFINAVETMEPVLHVIDLQIKSDKKKWGSHDVGLIIKSYHSIEGDVDTL